MRLETKQPLTSTSTLNFATTIEQTITRPIMSYQRMLLLHSVFRQAWIEEGESHPLRLQLFKPVSNPPSPKTISSHNPNLSSSNLPTLPPNPANPLRKRPHILPLQQPLHSKPLPSQLLQPRNPMHETMTRPTKPRYVL